MGDRHEEPVTQLQHEKIMEAEMTRMTRQDYYYGRASHARHRKCERLGAIPTQPSRKLSTVDTGDSVTVVRLRNVNGPLGTYRNGTRDRPASSWIGDGATTMRFPEGHMLTDATDGAS